VGLIDGCFSDGRLRSWDFLMVGRCDFATDDESHMPRSEGLLALFQLSPPISPPRNLTCYCGHDERGRIDQPFRFESLTSNYLLSATRQSCESRTILRHSSAAFSVPFTTYSCARGRISPHPQSHNFCNTARSSYLSKALTSISAYFFPTIANSILTPCLSCQSPNFIASAISHPS
jgi:hypothetical protein